jgi:hypothetical protein
MSLKRRVVDGNGKIVPIANSMNIFTSFVQSVNRKFFDVYPEQPWIPFEAARALRSIMQKEFTVWEVGSGYSTIWLSNIASHVTSVEASEDWFKRLSDIIRSKAIGNIDLRYEWRGHLMAQFPADVQFDLLFVDGGPRRDCLLNGARCVRDGGFIYCDNTDAAEFWGGSFKECLGLLNRDIKKVKFFTDYVPAMVGVSEGALIELK